MSHSSQSWHYMCLQLVLTFQYCLCLFKFLSSTVTEIKISGALTKIKVKNLWMTVMLMSTLYMKQVHENHQQKIIKTFWNHQITQVCQCFPTIHHSALPCQSCRAIHVLTQLQHNWVPVAFYNSYLYADKNQFVCTTATCSTAATTRHKTSMH